MIQENEDTSRYRVVVNEEEQYSIWFEDGDPPAGWRAVGVAGTKAVCLEHIATVWKDMRPLSLRLAMAARAGAAAPRERKSE